MKVQTGINDKDRKAIAAKLSKLLADSYTLYLKTHNYHWNVRAACSIRCILCSSSNTPNWHWP